MNIDDAIKSVAEKVLVLRFGRDEDSVCLHVRVCVCVLLYMCLFNRYLFNKYNYTLKVTI
uniref:Uncharacterized protein n=1 Tax=Cyprinus carpio TaxID=7962 RepID=A0A8C1NIN7_CYPCA